MTKKKITVIGTRGIPDVLGGVETHCQNLYPTIVAEGEYDVCVIARSPYVDYQYGDYRGVRTRALWAPKKRALEAIVHSTLAALASRFDGSDIVHVHAIGPGLVVPLLRLLGKKVVFTHHGPDYARQKWGVIARTMLLLGERCAVKYASEVIVISEVINTLVREKYGRNDAHLIYNGVNMPPALAENVVQETLSHFSLESGKYVVAVGRFVEEKGFHDVIEAWKLSGIDLPLVLVGDADHPSPYSERLKAMALRSGVILTGFLRKDALQAVFSRASLFVMPSYHEGLPIALLEAMSYSLPIVVSDIPANLEVALEQDAYFSVGNVPELAEKMRCRSHLPPPGYSAWLARYQWPYIAKMTTDVYHNLV